MNPLEWQREHQVALAVSALLGIGAGIVVGYAIYAVGWGAESVSFGYWINHPVTYTGIWWALFGAVFFAALVYVVRLMQHRAPPQ